MGKRSPCNRKKDKKLVGTGKGGGPETKTTGEPVIVKGDFRLVPTEEE